MAYRVQALQRQVISVIARLTGTSCPTDQGLPQAVTHFLLLFIQQLLRHLFPHESQVTNGRSEEHTSELQSLTNLVCRLLLEKKKNKLRAHRCTIYGDA